MTRPFRFGLLASRANSLAEWRDLARKAEDSGYSTLLVADHFGAQLAPIPAVMAAAAATSQLRVGTFVLDNDFRHPAALAKEAATVDLLTEGRFEFGIGAGWNPSDYTVSGIPFDPPAVRVSRLAEALEIFAAFFASNPHSAGSDRAATAADRVSSAAETVSFEGDHYLVRDLPAVPRARPRILIGANGPRMLRLAARFADIVNFPDRPRIGVSTAGNPGLGITFPSQMAVLREAAGPRFEQLELSVLCIPRVTAQVDETIAALASQMQTTPEIVHEMPSALVGEPSAIVDKLVQNREAFGLSYMVIPSSALADVQPIVRQLART